MLKTQSRYNFSQIRPRSTSVAAVHTWQFLTSKINNTSLLSPRESEQLLKNFKDTLQTNTRNRSTENIHKTLDHHFSSVLVSPLIRTSSIDGETSPESLFHQGTENRRELLTKNQVRPADVFRRHVARNGASLTLAKNCLSLQRLLLSASNSTAKKILEGPDENSRLGPLVLHWVWSTNQSLLDLLTNYPQFIAELIQCLTIEKHDPSIYWAWLEQLQEKSVASTDHHVNRKILPLQCKVMKDVIKAKFTHHGLQDATLFFVEATMKFASLKLPQDEVTRLGLLHRPGRIVAARLHRPQHKQRAGASVPTSLYEKMTETVPLWAPRPMQALYDARAQLFHPSKPTVKPALLVFERTNGHLQELHNPQDRGFLLKLGLHAAQACIARGNYMDGASPCKAAFILARLNLYFPDQCNDGGGISSLPKDVTSRRLRDILYAYNKALTRSSPQDHKELHSPSLG